MNASEPPFTPEDVKRHYKSLAGTYGAKENRTCKEAYCRVLLKKLGHASRVLEIGAGVSSVASLFPAPFRVACDLSQAMLHTASRETVRYCAADGTRLPFADASFDAVFAINVLEHLPKPESLITEASRVLVSGGECVFITPNGDCEWLLNLLERLRLKLPEGPHRFLAFTALRSMLPFSLKTIEHRRFLAMPIGSAVWVDIVDGMSAGKCGLFQLLHTRKTQGPSHTPP